MAIRYNLFIQIFATNKRLKRPGGSHEGVGRKKKPCSGWGFPGLVGGADPLGTAESSNQVERTDLTPIVHAELAFLMLSLRRLW